MSTAPTFTKILVATDGSPTAGVAVEHATGLARSLSAKLLILAAYDPDARGPVDQQEAKSLDAEWLSNAHDSATWVVRSAATEAGTAGVADVDTFAVPGDPADVIIEIAEREGVDLIVVGNKGMTGARRFLLGSVPNKVSHHAPCSVLIVRTS